MKYSTILSAAALSAWPVSGASLNFWGQSPLGRPSLPPRGGPVPGESPFMYCGERKDDILRLDYVDISPNPPQPGGTLKITASGVTSEAIVEGAYVSLDVRYGYVKLLQKQVDLCENAGEINLSCPLEQGGLSVMKEVDLPKAIPPGKYTVVADVYTVDHRPITCFWAETFIPRT